MGIFCCSHSSTHFCSVLMEMRTARRPRRYVSRQWMKLLAPVLRYSSTRDAYVLRGIGSHIGPVLRQDRREMQRRRLQGPDRRRASAA